MEEYNVAGKPRFFYGYVIVVSAFIIMAMWGGLLQVYGVFLKPMSTDLGWTRAITSGAYSLMVILSGLLHIIAGRLSDRLGPRILVIACGFFMGLGYLLMSQVNAIWQLYLFYGVIIGIGSSGTAHAPIMSTVARWFITRRALVTGIVGASMGIGTMIIVPLATRFISAYGWRAACIILGIMALAVFMLAGQFLRRDPGQMRQLPYGASEAEIKSPGSEAQGLSLHEAIHTGQFWMVCAIWLCSMFSMMIIGVHIIPHATDLGISPANAANILAIRAGATILGNIILGAAADRIGTRPALIISSILRTAALFWLLIAEELWMFYLFAVVAGLFGAGAGVLIYPILAELFGLRSLGVIVASSQSAGIVGGAISSTLAGLIFDVTGSYQLGFLICAAFSGLGLVLAWLLRPPSSGGQ